MGQEDCPPHIPRTGELNIIHCCYLSAHKHATKCTLTVLHVSTDKYNLRLTVKSVPQVRGWCLSWGPFCLVNCRKHSYLTVRWPENSWCSCLCVTHTTANKSREIIMAMCQVAHIYNPSYSGCQFKASLANGSILTTPNPKNC
jgi:hypothetical protein